MSDSEDTNDVSIGRRRLWRGGPRQWRKLVEAGDPVEPTQPKEVDDPLEQLHGEDLYEHLKKLAETSRKREQEPADGEARPGSRPGPLAEPPPVQEPLDDAAFPDDVEFLEDRWDSASTGSGEREGVSSSAPVVGGDGVPRGMAGAFPPWMDTLGEPLDEEAIDAMVRESEGGGGDLLLDLEVEGGADMREDDTSGRVREAVGGAGAVSTDGPGLPGSGGTEVAEGDLESLGEHTDEWELDHILSGELDHGDAGVGDASEVSGEVAGEAESRSGDLERLAPAETGSVQVAGEEEEDLLELSDYMVEVDHEDEDHAAETKEEGAGEVEVSASSDEHEERSVPVESGEGVDEARRISSGADPSDHGDDAPDTGAMPGDRHLHRVQAQPELDRISELQGALEEIGQGGDAPVVVDTLRPLETSEAGYVHVQEEVPEIEGDEAEEDDTLSTALGELEGNVGAYSVTPPDWHQTPSSETVRVLDGTSTEGSEAKGSEKGAVESSRLETVGVEEVSSEPVSVTGAPGPIETGAGSGELEEVSSEPAPPPIRASEPAPEVPVDSSPVLPGGEEGAARMVREPREETRKRSAGGARPWWLPPEVTRSDGEPDGPGGPDRGGREHVLRPPGPAKDRAPLFRRAGSRAPAARVRTATGEEDVRGPATRGRRGVSPAATRPGRPKRVDPWTGEELPFPVEGGTNEGAYRTLFDWPEGGKGGVDNLWGGLGPSWGPTDLQNGASPLAYFGKTRVDDRRVRPRIVGLTGMVYFRKDGRIATGELGNLSATGAMIRTLTPVPPGNTIPVALELPGLRRPLRLMARVVHVRRVRLASGHEVAAMGLFFERASPEEQRNLLRYLAQLGL